METFRNKPVITTELAKAMVEASEAKARELGIRVNTAVCDDGGHLVAFGRMDGAPVLSIGIAQNKAYTAVAFGLPTEQWYPMIAGEPALLHGIVHTERLVIFGGGAPVKIDGEVAGGIGVSGGSAEQDVICAEAALALLDQG